MEEAVIKMSDKELVEAFDLLDTSSRTDEWESLSQEMAKRSIPHRKLPSFMFD